MNLVNRFNNWPIWVRLLLAIWLMLVVAWSALIAWSVYEQRNTALTQAVTFSETMNEMTMAGLTTLMILWKMDDRDEFLDQILALHNMEDLRVLRSEAVSRQFGEGLAVSQPANAVEEQVLASGEAHIEVEPGVITFTRSSRTSTRGTTWVKTAWPVTPWPRRTRCWGRSACASACRR